MVILFLSVQSWMTWTLYDQLFPFFSGVFYGFFQFCHIHVSSLFDDVNPVCFMSSSFFIPSNIIKFSNEFNFITWQKSVSYSLVILDSSDISGLMLSKISLLITFAVQGMRSWRSQPNTIIQTNLFSVYLQLFSLSSICTHML